MVQYEYDDQAVRKLREALKLSQSKFAEKIGTTKSHVSYIESGGCPSMKVVERILNATGVDFSFFFLVKNNGGEK